jgi:hypothetical protein
MSSPSAIAAEFVRSYYTKLAFFPSDIPKFYDEDRATVWREQLNSTLAVPFASARDFLIPTIEEGSTVSVSSFAVLPVEKGFSLVVQGAIASDSSANFFTQFFTFGTVEGRFFIVADALSLRQSESAPETEGLVAVQIERKEGEGVAEVAPKPESEPTQPPAQRQGRRLAKKKEGGNPFVYSPNS